MWCYCTSLCANILSMGGVFRSQIKMFKTLSATFKITKKKFILLSISLKYKTFILIKFHVSSRNTSPAASRCVFLFSVDVAHVSGPKRQNRGSRGKVSFERVNRLTLTLGQRFSKRVCARPQLPRSPLHRMFTF